MKDIKPNLKPTLIACALCSVSSLSFASVDNLTVAGFPDYVSHGTITDNQANIAVDTQVDSVFKYAGLEVMVTMPNIGLRRTAHTTP